MPVKQRILKFGGTSMGSFESLEKVCGIITQNQKQNIQQVVVCSAMSQVTNKLIKIGQLAEISETSKALEIFEEIQTLHFKTAQAFGVEKKFEEVSQNLFKNLKNFIVGLGMIHELSDRSQAYLVSFGERLSTRLLTTILQSKKLKAIQYDSTFVNMKGLDYLEADIDFEATKKSTSKVIHKAFENKEIPIVTGFFGYDKKGIISLLGRGGSDFSGAIMAISLNIKTLEIWTDVDGFLSADPRIVENVKHIEELGFYEAAELCFFGAKVLHPATIRPVIDMGGNVFIKNTFNPNQKGTKITKSVKGDCHPFASVTTKKVLMLSLDIFGAQIRKQDIFAQLFTTAQTFGVSLDAMASSESMISFCVEEKYQHMTEFFEKLENLAPLKIQKERTIVCVVSPENVRGKFGIASELFLALKSAKISVEMYSQNASELVQLVVIESKNAEKAVQVIHEKNMQGSCFVGLRN